jgi:hypothetical protein
MTTLADEFKQFAPIIGGAVGSLFPGVGTVVGTGAGAVIGGLAGGLISYYSRPTIRSYQSIRSIRKVSAYRIPVYRRSVVSRSAIISKKTVSPVAVAVGAVAGAVVGNVAARLISPNPVPIAPIPANVYSSGPSLNPASPTAPAPVTVGTVVTESLLNSVPLVSIVRNAPVAIQTVNQIANTPVDSIFQSIANNPAINPVAAYNQAVSGAQTAWGFLSGLFNPPQEAPKPPQDAGIDTWTASIYG